MPQVTSTLTLFRNPTFRMLWVAAPLPLACAMSACRPTC